MNKDRKKNKNRVIIRSFLCRLIIFIVMIFIMFKFVFGITIMKNTHMQPSINPRDLMVYYRMERNLDVSDIVVFMKDNEEYIGRIGACPKDIINITEDSRLEVNNSIVVENRIYYKTPRYGENVKYPLQLGEEQYFILCDYREGSKDSRYFGPINKEQIRGKVITLIRRNSV